MTTPPTEPGWYPTADGRHHRYHDGTNWTEHLHPVAPPQPIEKKQPFVPIWLACTGAMTVFYLLSLAGSEEGIIDQSQGTSYAIGRVFGIVIGAAGFGALIAWPIWWVANRNRSA